MKTLRKNDTGAEVEILQKLLNLRDYNLKVDGHFGELTEKAVLAFQSSARDENGTALQIDGIVGNKTWWALLFEQKQHVEALKPSQLLEPDEITLKRIETAHPKLRNELKSIYQSILTEGVNVRFTSVFRSFKEQDELYARGRNGIPGTIVTNAKGGRSYHCTDAPCANGAPFF